MCLNDLSKGLQSHKFNNSKHLFAKIVSKAVEKAIPCKRIGTAVIGLEVPHAHIHLVPINEVSDIDFSQPKQQYSEEEMNAIAQSIREHLPKD